MAEVDTNGVLDLSTGPARERTPEIKQEPKLEPSSPNPSMISGSDSGLDTVDSSARNSTDNDGPPLSPSASITSPAKLSSLSPNHTQREHGLLPMPPIIFSPNSTPTLSIPISEAGEANTSASFSPKMQQATPYSTPYDAMSLMMSNPMAALAGATGVTPSTMIPHLPSLESPFSGSVTQLMSQRKRRAPTSRHTSNGTDSDHDLEGSPATKKPGNPVPSDKKDDSYWERRRRNNDAAKRSRDMRRRKEEEIAMRAAFLEQENLKLRAQVAILKNETAKLHYLLYNRI